MTYEEFKAKVAQQMKQKGYAPHKTDAEIAEAIAEYEDIVQDRFKDEHGTAHGIKCAADNISMLI